MIYTNIISVRYYPSELAINQMQALKSSIVPCRAHITRQIKIKHKEVLTNEKINPNLEHNRKSTEATELNKILNLHP